MQLSLPLIESEPTAKVAEGSELPGNPFSQEDRLAFRDRLDRAMSGQLGQLDFTRNRSTLVSARFAKTSRGPRKRQSSDRKIDLRVQALFVGAPNEVVQAVAELALGKARDTTHKTIHAFYNKALESGARLRPSRRVTLRPRGDVHDLTEMTERIKRDFLATFDLTDSDLEVSVTWGRRGKSLRGRRRARSILLGSYQEEHRLIRIHPVLDHESVPGYVVAAVLYHELLHAILPVEASGGRRCVHTPEFRRRERLDPNYERAERWLDKNLDALIRRRG